MWINRPVVISGSRLGDPSLGLTLRYLPWSSYLMAMVVERRGIAAMGRFLAAMVAVLLTLAGCGPTGEQLRVAGRYCRDGNPDKSGALQACNLLLEKNPAAADRARYLAARGFAYTRTEHYAEGIADLSASLKLAPDNISARLERAKAELKIGNTQAARADLDQILAEAPWTFDARMTRARMELEGGEYQLAVGDSGSRSVSVILLVSFVRDLFAGGLLPKCFASMTIQAHY